LYTGKQITPSVTVVCGGNLLTAGTDYNVSYGYNTNIGDAYIYISPASNPCYTGSTQIKFSICNDIGQATVGGVPSSQTYSKETITPEPKVIVGGKELTRGSDYNVIWTHDVNVGPASVVIVGAGKYAGTKTVNYNIIPKGIARCTVDQIPDMNYTGKAYTPSVVVRDGDKILAQGVDYTIQSYANNKDIGTATITIQGIGNYSWPTTAQFKIVSSQIAGVNASGQSSSSAKINWAKQSNITGYQVYTNNGRILLTQTKGTSYKLSGLKAGSTYKYKVRTYTTIKTKSGKKTVTKTYYGSFITVTFATKPNKPSITAISSSSRAANISWNKVSGASGYMVYRSTSPNGSYQNVATIISSKTVRYTNTGLTSGRTYYYKVRAYRTADNKNIYSAYSDVISVGVR
jgi:hypothetical protein